MRLLKAVTDFLDEATGTLVSLQIANCKVTAIIRRLEEKEDLAAAYGDDARAQLSLDVLLRHLNQEHDRRRIIEDKAKTNVLGITLAFSAMFAGVALISSSSAVRECSVHLPLWMLLVSLFIGGLFLLRGGALALSALRIAKIYTWALEDEVENTTDEARAVRVLWYVELNQMTTLLKTNHIDASYSCMRNGVIALAVAAIFISFSGLSL